MFALPVNNTYFPQRQSLRNSKPDDVVVNIYRNYIAMSRPLLNFHKGKWNHCVCCGMISLFLLAHCHWQAVHTVCLYSLYCVYVMEKKIGIHGNQVQFFSMYPELCACLHQRPECFTVPYTILAVPRTIRSSEKRFLMLFLDSAEATFPVWGHSPECCGYYGNHCCPHRPHLSQPWYFLSILCSIFLLLPSLGIAIIYHYLMLCLSTMQLVSHYQFVILCRTYSPCTPLLCAGLSQGVSAQSASVSASFLVK